MANNYNPNKAREPFGERDSEALMNELSENDYLEKYAPQRMKDLSYEDKKRSLESRILTSEKRATKTVMKKSKADMWQVVASTMPRMDMTNQMSHCQRSIPTAFFSQVLLRPTRIEQCLQQM